MTSFETNDPFLGSLSVAPDGRIDYQLDGDCSTVTLVLLSCRNEKSFHWLLSQQHEQHFQLTVEYYSIFTQNTLTQDHYTMKLLLSAVTLALAAVNANASVLSLTPANYDSATDGKTVFIKFFAPW